MHFPEHQSLSFCGSRSISFTTPFVPAILRLLRIACNRPTEDTLVGGCSRQLTNLEECEKFSAPMDRPGLDDRLIQLLVRVFQPVADVVAGGVVVTTVYLLETWPIQMHGDRGLLVPVSYPVDTPVTREHRGGAVLG